jgi:hypothetical protein
MHKQQLYTVAQEAVARIREAFPLLNKGGSHDGLVNRVTDSLWNQKLAPLFDGWDSEKIQWTVKVPAHVSDAFDEYLQYVDNAGVAPKGWLGS